MDTRALPTARTGPFRSSLGAFIVFSGATRIYGTFQFAGQYSWLVRHPWFVAPGQPASANLNMVYLGIPIYSSWDAALKVKRYPQATKSGDLEVMRRVLLW